jgi:hypothetical protein
MIKEVYGLRKRLLSQPHVLDGIDEKAKAQNIKLIDSLRYAGKVINEKHPNDVFGILLKGSRIKGYHHVESDADLILVSPLNAINDKNITDIITEAQKKYGVGEVNFNSCAQMWDTPIELDDFLYHCDHQDMLFNSMIGYEISSNPNLLIARLTVLTVISQWGGRFDWMSVKDTYNVNYLGEKDYDNQKIAERFNTPINKVNKIMNQSVWEERYEKFTLPRYEKLLQKYGEEFKKITGKKKYVMSEVHRKVMDDLKAGF